MKIRIKDNSVRFRLTKSEVAALGKMGVVSSTTEFADRPFVYKIESSEDEQISVLFTDNTMVLKMPELFISEWISTERVGFDAQSGLVKVLIEKDFACIDNTLEDQSDNYPNPSLQC